MVSTLIVGGGNGGLSLARELVMRGLPVTILEKTARIVPIGAGIIMNSNAMREFERRHGHLRLVLAGALGLLFGFTVVAIGRYFQGNRPATSRAPIAELRSNLASVKESIAKWTQSR